LFPLRQIFSSLSFSSKSTCTHYNMIEEDCIIIINIIFSSILLISIKKYCCWKCLYIHSAPEYINSYIWYSVKLTDYVFALVSSRLCRETKLGLIFSSLSLSLPLFPFLFSSSSSSSPRFSFSILHHITNRRRQLMNWRRYIVFEFLCIMAGRGQQTRERGKKFELKKKREKRRKKKRTCSVSTSLITIHISLTYVQNLLMIVLDHLLEI
jgi:hypothetical protein